MVEKLDISNLDIDEDGLFLILADIFERAEEQPEVIVIKRSQVSKLLPEAEDANPTQYNSDFGWHKLEIIE